MKWRRCRPIPASAAWGNSVDEASSFVALEEICEEYTTEQDAPSTKKENRDGI